MQSDRKIGHAPHSARLGGAIAAISGPCVGCDGCRGLCHALIEMMAVPQIVLGKGAAA